MSEGPELESLAASVVELRRRMILLARLLPAAYVRLLDADLDDLEAEALESDFLGGLSDSLELVTSDVETALREVWARTPAE